MFNQISKTAQLNDEAPLHEDVFISAYELQALQKSCGVREIVGWTYDIQGLISDGLTADALMRQ